MLLLSLLLSLFALLISLSILSLLSFTNNHTPNLPTKIIPTKIARLEFSGKFPYGYENSTP